MLLQSCPAQSAAAVPERRLNLRSLHFLPGGARLRGCFASCCLAACSCPPSCCLISPGAAVPAELSAELRSAALSPLLASVIGTLRLGNKIDLLPSWGASQSGVPTPSPCPAPAADLQRCDGSSGVNAVTDGASEGSMNTALDGAFMDLQRPPAAVSLSMGFRNSSAPQPASLEEPADLPARPSTTPTSISRTGYGNRGDGWLGVRGDGLQTLNRGFEKF